jgi:copper oxidase (laccase) domain-containing protein
VGHSVGRNVDLKAAAAQRLRDAGVTDVQDVGVCPICDERFFSHRRSGGITGRQAGVVWLGG